MNVQKALYKKNKLKITIIKVENGNEIDLDLLIKMFGEYTVKIYQLNNIFYQIEGRGNLQELITFEIIKSLNWKNIII